MFYCFLFCRYLLVVFRFLRFKNLSSTTWEKLFSSFKCQILAALKLAQTFRITNDRILAAGKQNELDTFVWIQVNLRPLYYPKTFTTLRFRNKKCFSVIYIELVLTALCDRSIIRITPLAVNSVYKNLSWWHSVDFFYF